MKYIKLFEQFISEAKVLQQGGDSFKKGQTVNFRLNSEVISGIIKAISLNKKDPKSSKITIQHKGDKGVTSKNSWKTVEIYADQLIVSDKYGDWNISENLDESNINEEKAKGDRGPLKGKAVETGIKNKSKESGVPVPLLRIIMRRGMDAWNSGHHPGMTQEGWGYARINAFLEKGKGTWGGADKDVAKEVRDGGHDKKLPFKSKED